MVPGNIPVAAESLEVLMKIGKPWVLRENSQALVLVTNDASDPCIVWASPKLLDYRAHMERSLRRRLRRICERMG